MSDTFLFHYQSNKFNSASEEQLDEDCIDFVSLRFVSFIFLLSFMDCILVVQDQRPWTHPYDKGIHTAPSGREN